MKQIISGKEIIGKSVLALVLVAALLGFAACTSAYPAMTPAPAAAAPTLTILFPLDGSTSTLGDVHVLVKVTNFNVVDKQDQANVPGEGHIHFFLDVAAPTTPGQVAIPTSGVWAHVAATTYTFKNLAEGTHIIAVELVNNDHTPLTPPVVAEITIKVGPASHLGPPLT